MDWSREDVALHKKKNRVAFVTLEPESRMGKKSGSGSGTNNPDHISYSLETIFGLKYLNSLMRIRDPRWEKLGSGSGIRGKKVGSGMYIPDPQHCKKNCSAGLGNIFGPGSHP